MGCFPNFLYVPELLAYFLGVKGSMDETGESVAIGFLVLGVGVVVVEVEAYLIFVTVATDISV